MSASGSHVTKAVTVVELLKRRVPVSDSATKRGWSISICIPCLYGIDQIEHILFTSLDCYGDSAWHGMAWRGVAASSDGRRLIVCECSRRKE